MVNVPILTYHSQNIAGALYSQNDHVALALDLELIHETGFKIVPLHQLIAFLLGETSGQDLEQAVCLTFDDGCNFDVQDLVHPAHGPQRSFLGIMNDFLQAREHQTQTNMHATSFVIASSEARRIIDSSQLFAKDWISDDWWQEADQNPLLSIESHGWDHKHPDLPGADRGGFLTVDTAEQCHQQLVRAGAEIESITGRRPGIFAYPFGESSDYIRNIFLPEHTDIHHCQAALGTDPAKVTAQTDHWNLPRYVCGRDWHSPEGLHQILLT